MAAAGSVVLVVLGYTLIKARFSSESHYSVFAKASGVVQRSSRVQQALGGQLHCYGERSTGGRGSGHAGIRHWTGVGRDGLRSTSIVFHVRSAHSNREATVRARMDERPGFLWNLWVFSELTVELSRRHRIDLLQDALHPPDFHSNDWNDA